MGSQPIFVCKANTFEFYLVFVPPLGGGMEINMKLLNKTTVLVFCIFFVLFSIVAFAVAALLSITRGGLPRIDIHKNIEGEDFNILLVMTDYRPEVFFDYDGESVENVLGNVSNGTGTRKIRTESILLLRFDSRRGELTLTAISGNTLATVKGKETTLDMVASDHGASILVEKIRAMTGLEIDSYIVFTPESAAKAFDMIGSFKYKISGDLVWQDPTLEIDINIKSGRQTFDGKKTVDLIKYYSYPSTYLYKDEILLDFTKKIIKNLTDDFTYDELCGIMSSISEMAVVKGELDGEQIKLLENSDKLDVKLLPLIGELDKALRFVPNEEATLEEFKQYRRIYSED